MGANEPPVIYIGHDSREPVASYVAAHSIQKRTNLNVKIRYIKHREQRQIGNFRRPWRVDSETGEWHDQIDNKTFSTEFSHTRFLVPHLMQYKGWALFIDSDMIFLSDIKKLFAHCDDKFAVMCVKHSYPPSKESLKMDGRAQRFYHRKNWSSFVLWNCAHPANRDISPEKVSFLPGRDLHSFSWLEDRLIGSLPFSYNFITGVSPKLPADCNIGRSGIPQPHVVHYSDGGPWFDECQNVPYAEWWVQEYEDWQRNGDGNKYSEIQTTRYE